MTALCCICLRDKLNLRSISNENLISFYDDLCDYDSGCNNKFCSECLYRLKKCYEFKKHCRLAVEKLKAWGKQHKSKKLPKNLLYTEMPTPKLSLCSKNNFKVYFYQTADVEVAAPIQISNSKNPHIVTINFPIAENIQKVDPFGAQEMSVEHADEHINFIKQEHDIKVEFVGYSDNENEVLDMDVFTVETKHNAKPKIESKRKPVRNLSDEELGSADDLTDSDSDSISNRESHSDNNEMDGFESDKSLKDLENMLEDLEKSNDNNGHPISKSGKRKPIDVEDLKAKLREKFERSGTVKDEKGNVIDMDTVLNNLDKITYLYPLKRLCMGPGPFSPLAINKLAKIHNRFANDDTSPFTKVFLVTQKEILEEFEKRRQNINYTKFPHRCESCIKSFPRSWFLDHHLKYSHNPDLPFECPICHIRRNTKRGLAQHTATHKRVLKCKLCTFTSGVSNIMITHVNTHNDVKYTCEHCGNVYKSRSCLAVHMNTHDARHVCALCAAAFSTEKGIYVHNLRKHAGEKFVQSEDNKKCEQCNVLFLSTEVYNKHVSKAHKGRERTACSYSCRICDWRGQTRLMQMRHYQVEHPDTDPNIIHDGYNYLCHDCGKRFKHESVYKDHMNTHTGVKPYSCNKCSKSFFSRIVLYTHMQSHLPPTKECSQCGKKFTTAVGLRNHMMRHMPPTKECPHCGKMFTTGTGLGVHLRIHRNDRRFKCNICWKGFLYSGALQAHVDGVHHNIRRKRKPRQHDMDIDSD